jgi:hypothetical protein
MKWDRQGHDEGDVRVRRLLALKRYELPDPYVETRVLAKLRAQLAHTAPGMSWSARIVERLTSSPLPMLRAMAAVTLAGLGLYIWLSSFDRNSELVEHIVVEKIVPEPIAEEVPALAIESSSDNFELSLKPVFVFEYPSNRQPTGPLRMGPSAVPVRYDF